MTVVYENMNDTEWFTFFFQQKKQELSNKINKYQVEKEEKGYFSDTKHT